MERIELLSPAGDMESFYAAIQNGADALYLGGKFFNARSRASNFSIDEISYLVRYAHIRGVKVYVTVNVLISDKEFGEAIDFLSELYLANVDGVIIQDIGLAYAVKEIFPGLNMHASTQMTVYNKHGVRFLKKLGFSRVVLAREMSLKEVEQLKDVIEIEMFGHGALCISYSGQCLFSSMIGGRSGNRGNCAGPCRLSYELVKEDNGRLQSIKKGYLMSPKDFSSISDIGRFIESGVSSLKIEGRVKTPEYVGVVTRIYRKYIDNVGVKVSDEDLKNLKQIFNRGGFTKGYIDGFVPCNMIATEKPKNWGLFLGYVLSYNIRKNLLRIKLSEPINIGDGIEVWNGEDCSPSVIISQIIFNNSMVKNANVGDIVDLGYIRGNIGVGNRVYKTSDKSLNQSVRIDKELKRVGLVAFFRIKIDKKLFIRVSDGDGNLVEKEAEVIGKAALNKPLSEERVISQMKKTGDTPFYFTNIDVDLDPDVTVPISEINNIRRLALGELEEIRAGKNIRNKPLDYERNKEKFLETDSDKTKPDKISIFFYDVDYSKPFWKLDVYRIYLPLFFINDDRYMDVVDKCRAKDIKVCLWTPFVTRVRYDMYIEKNLDKIRQFDGVLCGNIGTMEYLKSEGVKVLCDYSFNVFNSNTARYLKIKGVDLVTLSNELMLNQINSFDKVEGVQKEILVYGNLQVMISEYCVIGDACGKYKNGKCEGCYKNCSYYLKDRRGKLFRICCDSYTHRMTVFNSDLLFFGDNVTKLRGIDSIRLNILDEEWNKIEELIKLHKDMLNGVSSESKRIEIKDYTRGHLYREV